MASPRKGGLPILGSDESGEIYASDLSISVLAIRRTKGIVGYRNLLSYTSSLGIQILPETSTDSESWAHLGSGSYSITWKAKINGKDGKVVAIKQPKISFTRADLELENLVQHEALTSMIQELRILAHPKLKAHPNLPRILGVLFQEEANPPGIKPCLVFDLAISDLEKYLINNREHGIASQEMDRLSSDVADGICALHSCGLVHGDIKPDNILLFTRDGVLTATIGDLGTCGVFMQTSGVINGSQWYSAPEYQVRSPYREHANRSSRDVYNYGLVVWSILTYCREIPFPQESQYDIQHDDKGAIQFLLKRLPETRAEPELYKVIRRCVRAKPDLRPTIFEICSKLDTISSNTMQLEEIEQLVGSVLLTNPDTPRVNVLNKLPLPAQIIGKLRYEYSIASDQIDASRSALTLAALYSGAIGPSIDRPWNFVAKAQWLLKAVELGSHAAISPIMLDKNVLLLIEELGSRIMQLRHSYFESPIVDLDMLLSRLRGFAVMPDIDSLNILVFLGGDIPDSPALVDRIEQRTKVQNDVPNLFQLQRFTINRGADLEVIDSDAYDLAFSGASKIAQTVYNNSLEEFITQAEEHELKVGEDEVQNLMATAIFNGSMEIARYLVHRYEVNPNDSWNGTTHIDLGILFRRQRIVEFFIEQNATLHAAIDDKLSGLHLVSRHEDPDFVRMLCEQLRVRGQLSAVLESATTEGALAGWTAAYTAMACHAWKNLEVLLEYGANPNATCPEDGTRMIDIAVRPASPAVPLLILQILLEKGAQLDHIPENRLSPLMYAIQSSNLLAVFYLVLHGASVPEFAVQEAEEIDEDMRTSGHLPVLDEDGQEGLDGYKYASEAGSLIVAIVRIALEKQTDWEQNLKEILERSSQGCRGKMWVADANPTTYLIEVRTPNYR